CGSKYPWKGSKWDPDKCNTADADGFERSIAAAGSKATCRSRASGAYDMVGNVFEWTAEKRIVGGSFNSDEGVASCGYSSGKSPSSSAADIGFRCCASPN
ncbi:MAG: SUMF1/EgtB/PvdO family nonheme iron enzyme, partial [Myxococcota bacterium]|nr:SUMF1/EgtB/PvdO family nonheme iron enzyme [Myxococcota bacterium]